MTVEREIRADEERGFTAGNIIDRDALIKKLEEWFPAPMHAFVPALADEVLALARPVEGFVITPKEARLAELALREYGAEPYTLAYDDQDAMDALANRLETAA